MTTPNTQALDALQDAYKQGAHDYCQHGDVPDPKALDVDASDYIAALTPSRADTAGAVECITLEGQQGEPAGEMRVTAQLSDGRDILLIRSSGNVISHSVNLRFAIPPAPAGDAQGAVDGFDAWWKSMRVDSELPETLSDRDFAKAAWDAALAAAPTPEAPSGSQAGEGPSRECLLGVIADVRRAVSHAEACGFRYESEGYDPLHMIANIVLTTPAPADSGVRDAQLMGWRVIVDPENAPDYAMEGGGERFPSRIPNGAHMQAVVQGSRDSIAALRRLLAAKPESA